MAKILLVEDNEMNRDMLSRRLERRGFTVLIAADGGVGVELARSAAPDLILMDMSLPVIDGWEATRILKADPATAKIPVIASPPTPWPKTAPKPWPPVAMTSIPSLSSFLACWVKSTRCLRLRPARPPHRLRPRSHERHPSVGISALHGCALARQSGKIQRPEQSGHQG